MSWDPVKDGVGDFATPSAAELRVDLLEENPGPSPEEIRALKAERAAELQRIEDKLDVLSREHAERTGAVVVVRGEVVKPK